MRRMIDANALWADIMMLPHNGDMISSEEVEQAIKDAPTVDAVEVVHGRWVFGELDIMGQPVRCSVCGWGSDMVNRAMWLQYDGHKFCGNCGADMRGTADGKE